MKGPLGQDDRVVCAVLSHPNLERHSHCCAESAGRIDEGARASVQNGGPRVQNARGPLVGHAFKILGHRRGPLVGHAFKMQSFTDTLNTAAESSRRGTTAPLEQGRGGGHL